MTATIQIEHEAESHRAHISQLLDELRERATPGEVLDQLLGWEDGRDIARTFGRQVRGNPLPLTLIGAGIAWLIAGDAIRSHRPAMGDAERMQSTIASGLADAQRTSQSAFDGARGKASDLADSAGAAVGRAHQTASDTMAGASGTAASAWHKTSGAAQNTADAVRHAGSNLNSVARDQPLLAAGIAMAVGMALGAVVPVSDVENEMLGEQADALKAKAGDVARQGYGQAKSVVQHSYQAAADSAKDEIGKQGAGADGVHETKTPPETTRSRDGDGGGYGSSAYPHH